MAKTFVLGDIHGAYNALEQCLQRSAFDYHNDTLICLGDVCDGWPDTKKCIEELLKIKHLKFILGNHDLWALEWMQSGVANSIWLKQGGKATVASYAAGIPQSHISFLEQAYPYFIKEETLFVHAGIDPHRPLHEQSIEIFLWDRKLAHAALEAHLNIVDVSLTDFEEVYLGHTPISSSVPIKGGGVWLMDTGAGWAGTLSIMNINSKEVFISDPVPSLYPGIMGRTKH